MIRSRAGHTFRVRPLTTDLARADERPYFLWDEDRSVAEFRAALGDAAPPERYRLLGKLMREARDTDVWLFVSPQEVWTNFANIKRYLGRRRPFWTYLLTGWRRDGFLQRPADCPATRLLSCARRTAVRILPDGGVPSSPDGYCATAEPTI